LGQHLTGTFACIWAHVFLTSSSHHDGRSERSGRFEEMVMILTTKMMVVVVTVVAVVVKVSGRFEEGFQEDLGFSSYSSKPATESHNCTTFINCLKTKKGKAKY